MLRCGTLDELLKLVTETPGRVVQRRDACIPCHVIDILRYGTRESVVPIVLGKGALSANQAHHLIAEARHGSLLAVQLGSVEVLLDYRRTDCQTMLLHHGLEEVNNPRLLGSGAPIGVLYTAIIGVFLVSANQDLGEHAAAMVGLAQNQLDIVLLGNCQQRLERIVVVSAHRAATDNHGCRIVQQLKDCIQRLVEMFPAQPTSGPTNRSRARACWRWLPGSEPQTIIWLPLKESGTHAACDPAPQSLRDRRVGKQASTRTHEEMM